MTAPPDRPSGADLVAAIHDAARADGTPVLAFLRRMTKAPSSYLLQLAEAERPTLRTVARVRALIAGAEPLPARSYTAAHDVTAVPEASKPPVPPTAPVERDPCFRCGTRADLGCVHRAPSRPADPFRLAREAA